MSFAWNVAKLLLQSGAAIGVEQFVMRSLPAGGIMATTQLVIPKMYGALFITNCVLPSWVLVYLGFGIVSPARKKYNVEYPTMYAVSQKEGDDAYKFNCCQRAHQQALETYPIFLSCSLIGGLKHPILVALSGILWCYSRVMWAHGYATGSPGARYTYSAWGRYIWMALAIPMLCTISTAVSFMM